MSPAELLAFRLAGYEVHRSGAAVTLRCLACERRVITSAPAAGLDRLVQHALDHAEACTGVRS